MLTTEHIRELEEFQRLENAVRAGQTPCALFAVPEAAKPHIAAALGEARRARRLLAHVHHLTPVGGIAAKPAQDLGEVHAPHPASGGGSLTISSASVSKSCRLCSSTSSISRALPVRTYSW